jgi:hypothetical protein
MLTAESKLRAALALPARLLAGLKPQKPALFLAELGIFLGFVALALLLTWPILPKADHMAIDYGSNDPVLGARTLRIIIDWFLGNRGGALFDGDFFFPHPNSLASIDPGIGTALVVLPFRIFTDDYLLLLNLAIFVSFPLTAHAAYLLGRQITGSRACALVAGLAFGFCTYRFHQLDHASILQNQWILYSLCYLLRLRDDPTLRHGVLFGLFVFLTGVASANLALYAAPVYAIVGGWAIWTAPREKRFRFVAVLSCSALGAGLALIPFYAPFFELGRIYDLKRTPQQVQHFAARIEQFAAVPPYNWLYGTKLARFLGLESATFLGGTVLLLSAVGCCPWTDPAGEKRLSTEVSWYKRGLVMLFGVIRAAGFGAAFVFVVYACLWSGWASYLTVAAIVGMAVVTRFFPDLRLFPATPYLSPARLYLVIGTLYAMLCLGPQILHLGRSLGEGPWTVLGSLPGYGTVRTPARFFYVTSVAAALLAALGTRHLLAQLKSRIAQGSLLIVACAGILLEFWSAPLPMRLLPTLKDAPPVYRWLQTQPTPGAIVELPVGVDSFTQKRRMLFANLHRRPTVDAESSFVLPSMGWLHRDHILDGNGARHLERLAAAGLRYVVLHRAELPRNAGPGYNDLLEKVGARRVASFGPDEVLELPAASSVRPFAADNLVAQLEVAPFGPAASPLSVRVSIAPRGEFAVFEPKTRKLTLHAAFSRADERTERQAQVYFSPPLFAPGGAEQMKVDVPAFLPPGDYTATWQLVDEDGYPWAEVRTLIALLPVGRSPAPQGRLLPPACGVELLHRHRLPGNAVRVLARVTNTGGAPWPNNALPSFRIVEKMAVAGSAEPRPVHGGQLSALAPGSGLLLSWEIPVRPTDVVLFVEDPHRSPSCAAAVVLSGG